MCRSSHCSKEQPLAPCQRNDPLFLDSPASRVTASRHLSGTHHVIADADQQHLEFAVKELRSKAKVPRLCRGRISPESPHLLRALCVPSRATCTRLLGAGAGTWGQGK